MSKIAHISLKNSRKLAVLSDFKTGTAFVKQVTVNNRFTYKEFSLLLGIMVAIIILLVVWLYPAGNEASEVGGQTQPFLNLYSFKAAFQKIQSVAQLFL